MPFKDKEVEKAWRRAYMRDFRRGERRTRNTPRNTLPSKPRNTRVTPVTPAPVVTPISLPTSVGAVKPTTSTHNFSIRAYYTGTQPISRNVQHQGNRGNITVTTFFFHSFDIYVYKKAIALVAHEEVELQGNRAEKMKRVQAWTDALRSFCAHNGLILAGTRTGEWSDHPFEDEAINAVLVPFVREHDNNYGNRKVYLETTESHPDKVQIKGQESWEAERGAEYLFRVFPSQMVQFNDGLVALTEQMRLHLEVEAGTLKVQGETSATLKDIREALKRRD